MSYFDKHWLTNFIDAYVANDIMFTHKLAENKKETIETLKL